jgi:hypothetical protein
LALITPSMAPKRIPLTTLTTTYRTIPTSFALAAFPIAAVMG